MKHWVFDLDGTLVDSFTHYFACLDDIFRAHGMVFTDDLRHELVTDPLSEVFVRRFGETAAPSALAELQRRCNEDATIDPPIFFPLKASQTSSGS